MPEYMSYLRLEAMLRRIARLNLGETPEDLNPLYQTAGCLEGILDPHDAGKLANFLKTCLDGWERQRRVA